MTSRLPLLLATTVILAGACAHSAHTNGSATDVAATKQRPCTDAESYVVENHTGYPVRVVAAQTFHSTGGGASMVVADIPSGRVDTVRRVRNYPEIFVNVIRDPLPSGAPAPTSGLTVSCVPAAD